MNPNKHMAYQDDVVEVSRQYGHESIIDCAASMYPEKNTREIGEIFGVNKNTVRLWLIKAGVERKPQGGANNRSFTDEQIRQIRATNKTTKEIAETLRCNPQTIEKIQKGLTYRWVK